LATTCNKNEQQDAKNNAELYPKWTKMTWKTIEGLKKAYKSLARDG